jgi:hypothetical protein
MFNQQQHQQSENDATTMMKQAQLLAQQQQAGYLQALATQQADANTARNSQSVDFLISAMAGGGSTSDSDDTYSSLVVEELDLNPIDYI